MRNANDKALKNNALFTTLLVIGVFRITPLSPMIKILCNTRPHIAPTYIENYSQLQRQLF